MTHASNNRTVVWGSIIAVAVIAAAIVAYAIFSDGSTATITEVAVKYDMAPFFSGQVDVWPGYVINEVIVAEEQGHEVNVIWPSDYGINLYADSIFASEEMIENRPEVVRRFVQATLHGWEYAVEHPEEAVDFTLMYSEELTRDHELRMMDASIPLLQPDEKPIGSMTAARWQGMADLLHDQGFLKDPIDVQEAFTTEFLPDQQSDNANQVGNSAELIPVTVRLKWLHQAQFAGFYAARELGYYRDAGLDVTLNPGGVDFPAVQMVAGGSEDFGVTAGDQILLAREKDVPIVALAVIYRKSPMVYFAMQDSGITKPQDFVGRNVGVKPGGNEELTYRAMMKAVGIEINR